MNIEDSPTRVTVIAAGNENRLLKLLDEWLTAAGEEEAPDESVSVEIDSRINRIKVHRNGRRSTRDVQHAVRDWVRFRNNEFSVHEYPQAMEIWWRLETELRHGGYVATFAEGIDAYKIIGANDVEIGSISVGAQGWVATSRSFNSSWRRTTTEARDTPREALGELLRTLGY